MQSFTEGVQSMLLAAGVLRMGHHRVGALPTARRADGKRSGGAEGTQSGHDCVLCRASPRNYK